jgi:hypothetical protein
MQQALSRLPEEIYWLYSTIQSIDLRLWPSVGCTASTALYAHCAITSTSPEPSAVSTLGLWY